MRCEGLYAIALSVAVCGCFGGSGTPSNPKIAAGQIEKDAEAGFPSHRSDGAYEEGNIEILESNYSGDKATIVLSAGSINVGSLTPAGIDGLKPEIRPKVASVDPIPYRLRLNYQWIRDEWRLRQLENVTFEEQ